MQKAKTVSENADSVSKVRQMSRVGFFVIGNGHCLDIPVDRTRGSEEEILIVLRIKIGPISAI